MDIFAWWTPEGRYAQLLESLKTLEAIVLLTALEQCLKCEGWRVERDGVNITMWTNGDSYTRGVDWLLGCDYSDLPSGLRNDVEDIVNQNGGCA